MLVQCKEDTELSQFTAFSIPGVSRSVEHVTSKVKTGLWVCPSGLPARAGLSVVGVGDQLEGDERTVGRNPTVGAGAGPEPLYESLGGGAIANVVGGAPGWSRRNACWVCRA